MEGPVLTNRPDVEKWLADYWCRAPIVDQVDFLREQCGVQVKAKQARSFYEGEIRRRLGSAGDFTLRELLDKVPSPDKPEPEWNIVTAAALAPSSPAPEPAGTPVPLIIVRQAPTGAVAVVLWLSGEEGKGTAPYGLADDMAAIQRSPTARQELNDLVRGWLAEYPGARVESDIPLDLDTAPEVPGPAKVPAELPSATPSPEPPMPKAPAAPLAPVSADLFDLAYPIERIHVDSNVRRHFDEAKLAELARSINAVGILEPLLVRPADDGQSVILVAGERRLRAARLAGLQTVPLIVRPMTREAALEAQLTENIQRQDLDPLEEAQSYRTLIDELHWTQQQICERFAKSEGYISERLGLLEIDGFFPEITGAVTAGELSIRTAMAIRPLLPPVGVEPGSATRVVAERMVRDAWPVVKVAEQLQRLLKPGGYVSATKSLEPLRDKDSISYFTPSQAMFDRAECSKCPYRYQLKDEKHPICLNPPCWVEKQSAAIEMWKEQQRQDGSGKSPAERQKEQERHDRIVRAVNRNVQKVGDPGQLPSVDVLAESIIALHETAREAANAYRPAERTKAETRLLAAVNHLGFENISEAELYLGGGIGRTPAHSFQPEQLASRIVESLDAKLNRGLTPEGLARVKEQQRLAKAGPTVARLDPAIVAAATALRNLARPWEATTSPVVYRREFYLPVADLLAHCKDRASVATSGIATQFGNVVLTIPEQGIKIHDVEASKGLIDVVDGTLTLAFRSGSQVTDVDPGTPVYARIRVLAGGANGSYTLEQLVVMELPTRHVVIDGNGGAGVRKDNLPRWWAKMDQLAGFPQVETAEAPEPTAAAGD